MDNKNWMKGKKIWLKSGVCVLLSIGIMGGLWVRRREEKAEEDLQEIGQDLLKHRIEELKQQLGYEEFEWQCQLNQIEVVSKNKDEYLLKMNFDLMIADELECEYTTQNWMMRVKQINAKGYEIVEQGEELKEK